MADNRLNNWTKTQLFSFEILYWHNYSFQFRNRNFIHQNYWYIACTFDRRQIKYEVFDTFDRLTIRRSKNTGVNLSQVGFTVHEIDHFLAHKFSFGLICMNNFQMVRPFFPFRDISESKHLHRLYNVHTPNRRLIR